MTAFDVEAVRRRFSSLETGFGFFDAPGGSQVPDEVGQAIATTLRVASANLGAPYPTGQRVEKIVDDAKAGGARFFNCSPAEVVFGMNMTTINFALTRVLGRELKAGDEILVTRLDHDGNVAPWVELAEDLGLVLHHVDINADSTLDLDDLESKLNERTKVVAFPWASNVIGTLVDARRVCELAHGVGAIAWVDAVHYAAHEPMDVQAIDADVVLCSPYKFCGPHLGMAYVRESLARTWRPYKARPSATTPTARRFETGTLPYELLGGLIATFAYLEDIGGLAAIRAYERSLGEQFLNGLTDSTTVYGLPTMEGRVPTFLLNLDGIPARDVSLALAARDMGVWSHDTYYALGLYPRLGYDEAVRLGFIHYNTPDEVDRLLSELARLVEQAPLSPASR
jgi:cysteine desulfurase family protein (TIGR01976 family)